MAPLVNYLSITQIDRLILCRVGRCTIVQNCMFLGTVIMTWQLIKYCKKRGITLLSTTRWQHHRNVLLCHSMLAFTKSFKMNQRWSSYAEYCIQGCHFYLYYFNLLTVRSQVKYTFLTYCTVVFSYLLEPDIAHSTCTCTYYLAPSRMVTC